MKVLVDTDWTDLIDDLPAEKQAEVFLCILHYPDKHSELKVWNFIKKRIEHDRASYENKVAGAEKARSKKSELIKNKSALIESESEQIEKSSEQIIDGNKPNAAAHLPVIIDNNNNINTINKTNNKNTIGAMIGSLADSFRFDRESKYEIYHDFSFAELARHDKSLVEFLSIYPDEVIQKTQNALVRKCLGQKLALPAIQQWLDNNLKYHNENKGEKL
jgi:hypothetical protein